MFRSQPEPPSRKLEYLARSLSNTPQMTNDPLQVRFYPLDDIQVEFLKYAPAYAQKEAQIAIDRVFELQKQGVLRNGLYYIVLADLVGSTKYGVARGNDALSKRIEYFVLSAFNALNGAQIKNVSLFVKEIGDAVLFVFQHFPDIIEWASGFRKWLEIATRTGDDPYQVRICVNVGEVSLQGVNPLSLAVSQTFKMEKSVSAGQIVLTEPAYHVAWPTIARAYHGFTTIASIQLDGFKEPVSLYLLNTHDKDDLERIAKERLHENP
jgi:class 3 adenylate cyclase